MFGMKRIDQMDCKLIGGIFLVVGTSIGAGMLALPIVTAELGFLASLFLLLSVWFVMTCGALFLLEANLWLPKNSNLVSMAKATIGPMGQLTTWIIYLLLLYSLLCAYIAGGSDLFQALLAKQGLVFSPAFSAIIFTVLLSSIVYLGIHFVDYANRGLMIAKFITYFILIILLVPFIHLPQLAMGNFSHISKSTAITITVTSFGFASIVPSLRFYFDSDVKKLKKVIIFGGLIPLFCYIAWDAAIMGIIPIEGAGGLADILTAGRSTSGLVDTLNSKVSQHSVSFFVKFFT
jgi:tyrosine-specific transport protein